MIKLRTRSKRRSGTKRRPMKLKRYKNIGNVKSASIMGRVISANWTQEWPIGVVFPTNLAGVVNGSYQLGSNVNPFSIINPVTQIFLGNELGGAVNQNSPGYSSKFRDYLSTYRMVNIVGYKIEYLNTILGSQIPVNAYQGLSYTDLSLTVTPFDMAVNFLTPTQTFEYETDMRVQPLNTTSNGKGKYFRLPKYPSINPRTGIGALSTPFPSNAWNYLTNYELGSDIQMNLGFKYPPTVNVVTVGAAGSFSSFQVGIARVTTYVKVAFPVSNAGV